MSFSTGLAVPLFLFVASITCDKSFGQYGPWNEPQTYAVNGGTGFNNGMMYSGGGGEKSMGYGGSSAGAGAYGGGNGGMAFGGARASAGAERFDGGAADAGANSGAGGFRSAAVGNGARGFDGSAAGNGFGGFGAGSGGFGGGATGNGAGGFGGGATGNGAGGFGGGATGNGAGGFGGGATGNGAGGFGGGATGNGAGGLAVAAAGSGIQGFDVAPGGNFTPGFVGVAADNVVGGFVGGQGNAPPAAAATARGPAGYDGGAGGAFLPGPVRNGAWRSGRGRQRKIKPTFLSGGFSLKKSFAYVKNAFTSSYFKLSLPDSQNRVAKCSSLFKSAGLSLSSMYQTYFSLYNDISTSHDEMSFPEVGTLAFMEMALGIVKFLKSTPFACLMNVAGSFDYLSLMYSLLGLVGCDSLCVAKWSTYMNSAFS